MNESYQFDQVPPIRVAFMMICTPGHSFSPPCSRFRKTPRSIVCIFGTDADRLELRDDALAARVVIRHRGHPIDVEAVGIAGLGHQLLGLGDVVLPFRPVACRIRRRR